MKYNPKSIIDEVSAWKGVEKDYWKAVRLIIKFGNISRDRLNKLNRGLNPENKKFVEENIKKIKAKAAEVEEEKDNDSNPDAEIEIAKKAEAEKKAKAEAKAKKAKDKAEAENINTEEIIEDTK